MRFKIDWAGLIVGKKFTIFALFYFVFEGNFKVQAPGGGGGLIFGGQFNGGCFVLRVWGAYTWRDLFSEFYGILSAHAIIIIIIITIRVALAELNPWLIQFA